jgi:tripartite-type tricarboxylate transporter receptor subunit TctC
MMRRGPAAALILAGVLFAAAEAAAQQYPTRNVTIVVPFPPSGPTDQLARVVAQHLSAKLGHTFIVENVSGGGTIIATSRVARSTPDGHTLLLHNLQISANVTLYKNLPFDTERDLVPVMFINRNPLVLVGRKTLEANTLQELLASMKKQRVRVAIQGYGTTAHMATSLFAQEARVAIDQIPYRGAAPALTDLLGGHVDLCFATPQSVVQQVAVGQMKAYGITERERSSLLPTAESLVKVFGSKLEILYWQALLAPASTPEGVVNKLNAALGEIVADPAVLKSWAAEGVSPYPEDQRSPAAARALLKSEILRWGQVIRDNDIHADQ